MPIFIGCIPMNISKNATLKQLPIYANKRVSLEIAAITGTNYIPYSSAISAPES